MSLKVNHLVGFGAKRAAAAGGGSEGFIADSIDNGDGTIDLPAGAAADDIVLIAEFRNGATSGFTADQVPSGWTQFTDGTTPLSLNWSVASFTLQVQAYWKILTSGDVSSGTVTSAYSSDNPGMAAQLFRGPAAITAAAEQDCAAEDAGDVSAQTVNASGGTSPLINVAAAQPGGQISISPTADNVTTATTQSVSLHTTYFSSSPADWTVDDDGSGGNERIMSGYMELTT